MCTTNTHVKYFTVLPQLRVVDQDYSSLITCFFFSKTELGFWKNFVNVHAPGDEGKTNLFLQKLPFQTPVTA
jgi:hypothetical protein